MMPSLPPSDASTCKSNPLFHESLRCMIVVKLVDLEPMRFSRIHQTTLQLSVQVAASVKQAGR